jgi:CPA2 family monovalent cation:H+ antiporter-2
VGIASEYYFQLFLAVAVLTMAITPFLYRFAPRLERWVSFLPIPDKIISGYRPLKKIESKSRENHVVIVGYGLPGRVLASACSEAQIPYAIIDLDPNLIVNARKEGEPIYYGDATHTSVLEEVNVRKAEAIAILINDPLSTLRVLQHVRHLNENAYVIVRARWMNEVQALFQLGADDVIPDEFGVSIEVFARILRKNNINPGEIARIVAEKRHEEFEMIRHLYKEPETLLSISELGIGAIKVGKRSDFSGKTLAEIRLKEHYSVNPVMIRRGEATQMNLKGENILQEEDIIVIVGSEENIKLATKELSG